MKNRSLVLCLLLFALCLLMATQGLCLTDDGFIPAGCQQLFSSPESVGYLMLYYWVVFIGAVWDWLLGGSGIYGFRVLDCLTMLCIFLTVRATYRKDLSDRAICLGLVLIFTLHTEVGTFHYNTLTSLSAAVIVYAMHRAFSEQKRWLMLVAGVVMGMACWVRVPNVAMSLLITVLIPYYYIYRRGRQTWQLFGLALMGFAVGQGISLLTMMMAGHLPMVGDAVAAGFSMVGSDDNTHRLGSLLGAYVYSFRIMAVEALKLFIVPAVALLLPRVIRQKTLLTMLQWLMMMLYGVMLYRHLHALFAMNLLILLASAWYVGQWKRQPRMALLGWMVAVVVLMMPFGCDFGLENMQTCNLWLGGPLLVVAATEWLKKGRVGLPFLPQAVAVGILMLLAVNVRAFMGEAFYEEGTRFQKIYSVGRPLANTLTTEANAREMRTVLDTLSRYVRTGDELLVYPSAPMLHFLTRTRPYMGNPWPWVYDDASFIKHLNEAQQRGGLLPLVVWQKTQLNRMLRPDEHWNDARPTDNRDHHAKQIAALQRFLNDKEYFVLWEDEYVQISASLAYEKDDFPVYNEWPRR